MELIAFLAIFIIQLVFWLFLNFTKTGKVISAIWGGMTFMGFVVNIYYPGYLKALTIGFSGDIGAVGDLIEEFMMNSIYFLIQFVVPPWLGLGLGLYADRGNNIYHRGGAI